MTFLQLFLIGLIFFLNFSILVMTLGTLFGASFGAPFVPSGRKTVAKMIEIADLKKNQKIFDLGCGDGRLVFAAAKKGARATGIEISPIVFFLAKIRGFFAREKKAKIRFGNIFSEKFRDEIQNADVIFAFLLPPMMTRLFDEIFPKMKKNSKIISHAFSPKNVSPTKVFPKTKHHGKILVFEKKDF